MMLILLAMTTTMMVIQNVAHFVSLSSFFQQMHNARKNWNEKENLMLVDASHNPILMTMIIGMVIINEMSFQS